LGAAFADGVEGWLHDLGGVDVPLVGQHRLDHDWSGRRGRMN
jgi:hypothetical protein